MPWCSLDALTLVIERNEIKDIYPILIVLPLGIEVEYCQPSRLKWEGVSWKRRRARRQSLRSSCDCFVMPLEIQHRYLNFMAGELVKAIVTSAGSRD